MTTSISLLCLQMYQHPSHTSSMKNLRCKKFGHWENFGTFYKKSKILRQMATALQHLSLTPEPNPASDKQCKSISIFKAYFATNSLHNLNNVLFHTRKAGTPNQKPNLQKLIQCTSKISNLKTSENFHFKIKTLALHESPSNMMKVTRKNTIDWKFCLPDPYEMQILCPNLFSAILNLWLKKSDNVSCCFVFFLELKHNKQTKSTCLCQNPQCVPVFPIRWQGVTFWFPVLACSMLAPFKSPERHKETDLSGMMTLRIERWTCCCGIIHDSCIIGGLGGVGGNQL